MPVQHNYRRHLYLCAVAVFFLIVCVPVCDANGSNPYFLPAVDGKLNFDGGRFTDRDETGTVRGYKSTVFKKGYRLIFDPNPFSPGFVGYPNFSAIKLFLVKDRDTSGQREKDTEQRKLREIRGLADLQGFVRIKSETDAFEFLRLASSRFTRRFNSRIQEVFCVDAVDPNVRSLQVTHSECMIYGFRHPQIQRVSREEPEKEKNAKDGVKQGRDAENKDTEAGDFFLVTRTIYSSNARGFVRLTEEVGPAGQWRIVKEELITPHNKNNDFLFTRNQLKIKR